MKKKLRQLDESETVYFNKILETIDNLTKKGELFLLYRATDKSFYPNVSKGVYIEDISDFFYNYIHGIEKGRHFLTEQPDNINFTSNEVFIDIFNKIQLSLDIYKHNDDFKNFFSDNSNRERFIEEINNLDNPKKIKFKDYYSAYLHTIGRKETGKDISYFVSTSKNIEEAIKFLEKNNLEKSNQVLTYYLLANPYGVSAIDSQEHNSLNEDNFGNHFPRYQALHIDEDEISIKGGLFPNHILGIRCYLNDKEVFLVNPYLFIKGKTLENMLIEGIPVNQKEVKEQIRRNEISIVYKDSENNVFN